MECKSVEVRRGRATVIDGLTAKSQNASPWVSYITPRGGVGLFVGFYFPSAGARGFYLQNNRR